MPVDDAPAARTGRPQATSHRDLELVALDLFSRHGFDDVSVTDIATAAGISRRTFFRYYSSKNDAVWGEFDPLLRRHGGPPGAAATARSCPRSPRPWWRSTRWRPTPCRPTGSGCRSSCTPRRSRPTARSATPTGGRWWPATPPAPSASRSTGSRPQLVAHVSLAAAVAAHEQWLADDASDLTALLRDAFDRLHVDL